MTYKRVQGFLLQDSPCIYVAGISGKWLLDHATPSWRSTDPILGFQRIVREERARQIAIGVLNQQRTFPNAIILATNVGIEPLGEGALKVPSNIKMLVVDGQHRLWAQKFSDFEPVYACIIHTGLSEVEMAKLFLEINENQKRVPPSLRWDLVRLVRPDSDPAGVRAADMIYELATDDRSPLFQRVDLTGEQNQLLIKQATLAPEFKLLLTSKRTEFRLCNYDIQYEQIRNYFVAISSLDRSGWRDGSSVFSGARVLRALLKVLLDLVIAVDKPIRDLKPDSYLKYLRKIDADSLSTESLKAIQGSAGIRDITQTILGQMELQ